jgi:hypothetical protein
MSNFGQKERATELQRLDVYLKKKYGNTGRHSNKGKDHNTN